MAAYANLTLDSLVAILVDNVNPLAACLLVEGAAGDDDLIHGLPELKVEVICLTGPDIVRLLAVKLEVGLELAVAHFGIYLPDNS